MHLRQLQILQVQEHCLEFYKRYLIILQLVMLVHDFVEVVLRDVVAYFVHGCDYVLGRDMSRTVRVELIENCLQLVIVHEGLHVQRRHQELRVVNLIIAKVVDLCDDLVDLIISHVEV